MENLNTLEQILLDRLSLRYPIVKLHMPFLKVLNRECTGVGMYVNFEDYELPRDIPQIEVYLGVISTNENIEIKGLEYGLGYELCIEGGKISFFEFITYGEDWDCNIDGFKVVTVPMS